MALSPAIFMCGTFFIRFTRYFHDKNQTHTQTINNYCFMCKRMANLWNDNVHHNNAYIRYRLYCIALNNSLSFFSVVARSSIILSKMCVCTADWKCLMVAFAIKRHIAHTIGRLIKPKIQRKDGTSVLGGYILPWRLIFRIWLIFLRRLVLNVWWWPFI